MIITIESSSKSPQTKAEPPAPYQTPGDPPCLPGLYSDLPRWVELEHSRLARMEANGWVDEEPPSPAQVRFLRSLGVPEPPLAKDEASLLITRLVRARKKKRSAA